MKTIQNYSELGELSTEAKRIIYERMHDRIHQDYLLKLIPKGKSVWLDSFGHDLGSNIIPFENQKWKTIFSLPNSIKYYNNFRSPTLIQSINKYIKPLSIIIYQSEEFMYVNKKELIDIIKFLIKSFPKIKLLIYIDTIFIDYNKLKFTGKHIIENTQKNITQNTTIHTYDKFKYIFEIN